MRSWCLNILNKISYLNNEEKLLSIGNCQLANFTRKEIYISDCERGAADNEIIKEPVNDSE